ncbi:MAG: hypothetical protein ACPLZ9_04965 [Candidatus Ratteibacteria bacterium]|jgi:hypothetical protein
MKFNSFLNLPPLVLGYFLGYALKLGIISPIFEVIPKNTSKQVRVITKIKVLFSRTKNKKGGIKDGK